MPHKTGTGDFGAHSTAEDVTDGLDLTGQTWLITGCNSGLGLESARVLTLRGAHVVGTARTAPKATDAMGPLGATPVACELADPASIRAAVAEVRRGPRLHGIIANAGIMALQQLQQAHGVELQFFVNHVGHFQLVTGLLDHLAEGARVVVLSSGAHRMARKSGLELDNLSGERDYHPWRMYGRSKLANILFARALSTRLEGGRTANAVHPGVIDTNLGRHVPDAAGMYARMQDQLKTVAQGAATQCLVATHPSLARTTGAYFSDCQRTAPVPIALDDEAAEQLWARTEALVSTL